LTTPRSGGISSDYQDMPGSVELIALMEPDNQKGRKMIAGEKAAEYVKMNPAQGLTEHDIRVRQELYGRNCMNKREPDSFWTLAYNNANDTVIILIFFAGIGAMLVNLLEGEEYFYIEGCVTILTVILVVLFSAAFEYFRERQFIRLMDSVEKFNVVAMRDGHLMAIIAQEVVVGDLIYLETGDVPPGDGILISGEVDSDEASLTGETEVIEKKPHEDNAIYGNTNVTAGSGYMVILCTGSNSIVGQVSKSMDEDDDEEEEKSGLEARLEDMASAIGYGAMIAAVTFFFVALCEYLILGWADQLPHNLDDASDYIHMVFDLLVSSLLLLILGIPEGLPVAISLTLVLGAKTMESENVLVKRPKKGEIMGTVTTVCTDKTGTLTTGNMVVHSMLLGGVEFTNLERVSKELPEGMVDQIVLNLALNSTCRVSTSTCFIGASEESGNNTEKALLRVVGNHFQVDFNVLRKAHRSLWTASFSSTRKASSVVLNLGGEHMLYTKGAPEVVLDLCVRRLDQAGEVVEFTAEDKAEMLALASNRAMRCVALAMRELPAMYSVADAPKADPKQAGLPQGTPEESLTLIGLTFLQDPVRPDVREALYACRGAGVNVIMVTGDSASTAKAVALESGLMSIGDNSRHSLLEGSQFRKMVSLRHSGVTVEEDENDFNQAAFDKIWPELRVLARSSPIDKYLLVKGLMESKLYETGRLDIHPDKQIVAVTGDGVNDIAAMNKAHVGVAMGGGQQAAIEIAEVVLTDDNFSSCVTGIKWGRNIRDAACKFIQFQITITVVFVIFLVASVCFCFETLPLSLVQSLWINLVQDTLGALTLASDVASADLLKRRPVSDEAPLVTKMMARNIIGQSIFQSINLIIMVNMAERFFSNDVDSDNVNDYKMTVAFNFMVLQTLANQFCMRMIHGEYNFFAGLERNPWFCGVASCEFCLQVLIVSAAGDFFQCEPVSLQSWAKMIVFAFGGVWTFQILLNAGYWYFTTGGIEAVNSDEGTSLEKKGIVLQVDTFPRGGYGALTV